MILPEAKLKSDTTPQYIELEQNIPDTTAIPESKVFLILKDAPFNGVGQILANAGYAFDSELDILIKIHQSVKFYRHI